MKNISFLCVLLCSLAMVTSCAKQDLSDKEISFNELFPIDDLNNSIKLGRYPVFENGDPDEKLPEAGESFIVFLTNSSSDNFYFPGSENPNFFYYDEQENQWSKVEDMNHSDTDITLLSETEGFEIGVAPCFLQVAHPTEVRVAMIGYKIQNGQPTTSKVGAYLDVIIQPRNTCDQGYCINLAIDHNPATPDRIDVTTTVITPMIRNHFEVFIGTNDSTAVFEDINLPIVQWNGLEGRIRAVDTQANTPISNLVTITFSVMGQKTIYASVYPSYESVILASDYLIYDYDEEEGRIITSCTDIEYP